MGKVVNMRYQPRQTGDALETRDDKAHIALKMRRKRLADKLFKGKDLTREERLSRVADLLTYVVEQEALVVSATASYIDVLAQTDKEKRKELLAERNDVVKQVKELLAVESGIRKMAKTVGDIDRAEKGEKTDSELANAQQADELVDDTMLKALQILEQSQNVSKKEIHEVAAKTGTE